MGHKILGAVGMFLSLWGYGVMMAASSNASDSHGCSGIAVWGRPGLRRGVFAVPSPEGGREED